MVLLRPSPASKAEKPGICTVIVGILVWGRESGWKKNASLKGFKCWKEVNSCGHETVFSTQIFLKKYDAYLPSKYIFTLYLSLSLIPIKKILRIVVWWNTVYCHPLPRTTVHVISHPLTGLSGQVEEEVEWSGSRNFAALYMAAKICQNMTSPYIFCINWKRKYCNLYPQEKLGKRLSKKKSVSCPHSPHSFAVCIHPTSYFHHSIVHMSHHETPLHESQVWVCLKSDPSTLLHVGLSRPQGK